MPWKLWQSRLSPNVGGWLGTELLADLEDALAIEIQQKRDPLYTGRLIEELIDSVQKTEQTFARRAYKENHSPSVSVEEFRSQPESRLQAEQLAQPFRLSAADWNLALLLIIHAQLVRALEPRHDFANAIDVYQVGTVSAPK